MTWNMAVSEQAQPGPLHRHPGQAPGSAPCAARG